MAVLFYFLCWIYLFLLELVSFCAKNWKNIEFQCQKWKQDSQTTTFPLRERSERVGLSACIKHGHVVPSKHCKQLPFDEVHPSFQTLVGQSLDGEIPNCQYKLCHSALVICLSYSLLRQNEILIQSKSLKTPKREKCA